MQSKLFLTLEFPPDVGGAGSFASDVISASKGALFITPRESNGARVSFLLRPLLAVNNRYLNFVVYLIAILFSDGKKIREVYCLNYSAFLIYQLFHRLLGLKGKKVVWVLHGEEDEYIVLRKSSRDLLLVSQGMIEFAKECVHHKFISLDLKNKFERKVYVAKNGSLLRHGINTDFWKRSNPTCIGNKKVNLIYTGRIVRDKGVFDLLLVLQRLPEYFSLVIAGTGKDEDALVESMIKLNLTNRVTLLGPRSKTELRSDLSKSDCFIFLSFRSGETFGLSTYEAMSCNLPAIVLRQPYTDDFADKTWPYLIKSQEEISEALLLKIIDSAKSNSPRNVVIEHYSLADMLDSLFI